MLSKGRRFFYGGASAWTKQGDRFGWRMKSTVESPSLWLSLPATLSADDGGGIRDRHMQVPLCQVLVAPNADQGAVGGDAVSGDGADGDGGADGGGSGSGSKPTPTLMLDLNSAQRAEVCMRPGAALQYAKHLEATQGAGRSRALTTAQRSIINLLENTDGVHRPA